MTERREVLKQMAAAFLLSTTRLPRHEAATADPSDAAPALPVPVDRVGVQLYTVRTEMEKSVEATLAHVSKIGYRQVEFAGYFGQTPKQIGEILKANGLTSPAAHMDLNAIRKSWPQTLDAANEIGHRYLVCPWMPEEERKSADDYKRFADEFNKAGEAARGRGIQFAYHNHDFEFQKFGGVPGYDTLLAATDPKLVQLELDLYWITKAGQDPLAYFAKYPGRFPLVHVKDMTSAGMMVDVGSGSIPFEKIFAKSSVAGIKHYFVEHDEPKLPFESIAKSFAALRALPAK